MKRLNPNTGLPFKRGDLREDGYIFQTYSLTRLKPDGYFVEHWATKKAFATQITANKKACKSHRDNQMSSKNGHISLILSNTKHRAIKYNIPFDLTLEYLISIAPDSCPALGLTLGWCERNKTMQPHSPSLDKIDPNKGYVKGNVQWLSQLANTMKHNATNSQLISFANWVLNT